LANSYSVNTSVSITYCTFTNSSIYIALSPGSGWDGNLTFSHNYFLSSLVNTASYASFSLACNIVPSAGTLVCSSNYFDNGIDITSKNLTFSNNFCISQQSPVESAISFGTYSSWSSASYCSGNLFIRGDTLNNPIGLYGSMQNCYLLENVTGDVHGFSINGSLSAYTYSGLVQENPNHSSNGGVLFIGALSGPATVDIYNNIILPNGDGLASGNLSVNLSTNGYASVTCEHNTSCVAGGQTGLCEVGESGTPGYPSQPSTIASIRANLCYASSAATDVWAGQDYSPPSCTPATNALYSHGAGFNGFWNPNTGTCNINGSDVTLIGYTGLVVTNGTLAHSGETVTGDVVVTSNPFVDSTRNFVSWGTHVGVSLSSVANVTTYLSNIANGTLDTLIPALRSWVCEGFRVTATAFKGTSYSGDASTTDADGNAWSGATPDIGAMAYQSASVPIYRNFTTLGALGN
jgi:hypothetical protein